MTRLAHPVLYELHDLQNKTVEGLERLGTLTHAARLHRGGGGDQATCVLQTEPIVHTWAFNGLTAARSRGLSSAADETSAFISRRPFASSRSAKNSDEEQQQQQRNDRSHSQVDTHRGSACLSEILCTCTHTHTQPHPLLQSPSCTAA